MWRSNSDILGKRVEQLATVLSRDVTNVRNVIGLVLMLPKVCLDAQAAEGPQLPLGAEAVWRL